MHQSVHPLLTWAIIPCILYSEPVLSSSKTMGLTFSVGSGGRRRAGQNCLTLPIPPVCLKVIVFWDVTRWLPGTLLTKAEIKNLFIFISLLSLSSRNGKHFPKAFLVLLFSIQILRMEIPTYKAALRCVGGISPRFPTCCVAEPGDWMIVFLSFASQGPECFIYMILNLPLGPSYNLSVVSLPQSPYPELISFPFPTSPVWKHALNFCLGGCTQILPWLLFITYGGDFLC